MTLSHLHALELRRSHERARLNAASTDRERDMRRVWVDQIEREIHAERELLGLPAAEVAPDVAALSPDDLFALLGDSEPGHPA